MVKVIEHKGLHVFLDSSEFNEIRVVGRYKNRESIGILELEWGTLHSIRITHDHEERHPLPSKMLVEFEDILSLYSEDIIELWTRLVGSFKQDDYPESKSVMNQGNYTKH